MPELEGEKMNGLVFFLTGQRQEIQFEDGEEESRSDKCGCVCMCIF